jgi:hypothetical protein
VLEFIDSKWSGVSRTRFDYVTNNRYQREREKQSGSAYADYGDATFEKFTYNARGELTDAPSYLGSNVADTSKPLQGRQHAYGYDSIGNRKWTNRTTNAAFKESFFGTTGGTGEGANNLNQYRSRENDAIHMDGAVDAASTTVAVTGVLSFFLPRPTAALVAMFQGGVALPVAFWLERRMGSGVMAADNPLRPLSVQLAMSQALALPALIVVYSLNPGAIPVVLASLGGVHFFPYAWLHRSRIYIILGSAVAIGGFILQVLLGGDAFSVILLYVGVVYWIASPLLVRHAKQVTGG